MSDTPTIHFLRQNNGRRLAYATHGSGPPLVCPAWWVSHLEEDWDDPGFRELFGGLAKHYTVIRYDRPGAGLSDRSREVVDLEGEVATLSELVEHLELDELSLFAISCAGPPALRYAAAHPDRVSSLVFFGSFVRGEDVGPSEVKRAIQGLIRAHWGLGSRTITNLFAPDLPETDVKKMSRQHRNAASPEMAAQLLSLTFDVDAASAAEGLKTPVLVLHRKGDQTIRHEAGRELAACLFNSTLETLPGNAHAPWLGDTAAVLSAILRFVGTDGPDHEAPTLGNAFRRSGDVWTLTYGDRSVHLKHARGLTDLAILLARPREEIHVGVLWSGADSAAATGGSDPILDDEALASYRARFLELEKDIAEAEERGNVDVAERHKDERDALGRELRSAVGLGGRRRGLDEPSERARKAVSARIRATIKKIESLHPALHAHLDASITTGNYCSYSPSEDIEWTLSESR